MRDLSRREFLQALAALGAACASPAPRAQGPLRFADNPFRLGVASGYPRPDGAVIWTRLVPDIAQASGGKLAEGAFTAPVLLEMAAARNIDMPIHSAIAAVLSGKSSVDDAIKSLLARPFGVEE